MKLSRQTETIWKFENSDTSIIALFTNLLAIPFAIVFPILSQRSQFEIRLGFTFALAARATTRSDSSLGRMR